MLRAVPAPLHPATDLSRGFRQIVDAMCRAIAERAARDAAAGALLVLLWGRLRRLAGRLASVAAHAAAGTLRVPPRRAAPPVPPRTRVADKLPRSLTALARLAPEAARYGGQLQVLLSHPDVAALLAEAPRLARYVRPLCRLLGVAPGPALPSPPRARPPSRAAGGGRHAAPAAPAPPRVSVLLRRRPPKPA
jgi:hypothetical protein